MKSKLLLIGISVFMASTCAQAENFKLTVILPAGSGGQVRDNPQNIRCGDDSPAGYSTKCSFSYPKGTVVPLYYQPKQGMTWGGWTGACAGQRDNCKVTMTADMTVSTSFKTVGTWKLSMAAPNGGSISGGASGQGFNCPGECTKEITLGANASLSTKSSLGYAFEAWTGPCGGQGAICTVAAGTTGTVGVTFKKIGTATITVTQPKLGQIRDSPQNIRCGDDNPAGASTKCSFTYTKGELVQFYYSVKSGHAFVGWTGACANSGANCVITADSDKTLSATFK